MAKEVEYSYDLPELKFEICVPAQKIKTKSDPGKLTSTIKNQIREHFSKKFIEKGQKAILEEAEKAKLKIQIGDKDFTIKFDQTSTGWFPASIIPRGIDREKVLELCRTKPKREINRLYKDTKVPALRFKECKTLLNIYENVGLSKLYIADQSVLTFFKNEIKNGVIKLSSEDKELGLQFITRIVESHLSVSKRVRTGVNIKDQRAMRISSSVVGTLKELIEERELKKLAKAEEERVKNKIW